MYTALLRHSDIIASLQTSSAATSQNWPDSTDTSVHYSLLGVAPRTPCACGRICGAPFQISKLSPRTPCLEGWNCQLLVERIYWPEARTIITIQAAAPSVFEFALPISHAAFTSPRPHTHQLRDISVQRSQLPHHLLTQHQPPSLPPSKQHRTTNVNMPTAVIAEAPFWSLSFAFQGVGSQILVCIQFMIFVYIILQFPQPLHPETKKYHLDLQASLLLLHEQRAAYIQAVQDLKEIKEALGLGKEKKSIEKF